ncbi:MAG: hypothetical protein KDE63_10610 [Novosphingobium sp.]|nr:hypothetical protein [Novosphingobium sp.]
MIGWLRRIFGGHGPSIYSREEFSDEQYDPETQELILSSFDLLEHITNKGEALDSERLVNHFFSGEPANVQRSIPVFQDMLYLTDIHEPHLLHVVGRATLSRSWVEMTIPKMCRIAGEFELNYDGWDCGPEIGPNDQPIILD